MPAGDVQAAGEWLTMMEDHVDDDDAPFVVLEEDIELLTGWYYGDAHHFTSTLRLREKQATRKHTDADQVEQAMLAKMLQSARIWHRVQSKPGQ